MLQLRLKPLARSLCKTCSRLDHYVKPSECSACFHRCVLCSRSAFTPIKKSSCLHECEVNLFALRIRVHVSANRDAGIYFDSAGDGFLVAYMEDRRPDCIVTSPPCTNALELLVCAKRSPASGLLEAETSFSKARDKGTVVEECLYYVHDGLASRRVSRKVALRA